MALNTLLAQGTKLRLTMTRYRLREGGTIQLERGVKFEVLINPGDYKHTAGIVYEKHKTLGEANGKPRFAAVNDEKLSFTLTLDGTGVVPSSQTGGRAGAPLSVRQQLDQLHTVCYRYVGPQHETPYTRLIWGTLIFFGRLESMNTTCTLFKPSGEPLRAKVELHFIGSMSKEEDDLVSNRSSPDLTHRVLVREGDTLPLLCDRIYGDPGWYLDVAEFNRLADFRALRPGSQLVFPPLQ
jgi:Contractile injection system tube protein